MASSEIFFMVVQEEEDVPDDDILNQMITRSHDEYALFQVCPRASGVVLFSVWGGKRKRVMEEVVDLLTMFVVFFIVFVRKWTKSGKCLRNR